MEIRHNHTMVWSLVSVFVDPARPPWHEVHTTIQTMRDSMMSACFGCRYTEPAAERFVEMLLRDRRADLRHEDGTPYCTVHIQWTVLR